MFLSNKIVYGYAIALCITCLGTATGLLLGNHYQLGQVKVLDLQISITSLLLSVAIAALFIKYISHGIVP
jgi:ABC-type antimicrobial peptide transport system permease subunit